ncbi:MAG: ABC transporter ATP-binding protein [Clostridia bacterium]|nr:ABC transporter ATP-binding protein [Clostridia bacterium]
MKKTEDLTSKKENPYAALFTHWGIEAKQVKEVCPTDMDLSLNYRRGYVVLTEEGLYVFSAPQQLKRLDMTDKKPQPLDDNSEYVFYSTDSITRLSVESQVACVSLVAQIDGAERILAVTSECNAAKMRHLARLVTLEEEEHNGNFHGKPDRPMHSGRGGFGRPPMDAPKGKGAGFKSRMGQFARLMGFFKPYSIGVVAVVFCFLATAVIGLISPYLNGKVLYGQVLEKNIGTSELEKAAGALLLTILAMLVVKIANSFFSSAHSLIVAKFVPRVIRDIKNKVFDAMSRLSISFYQSRETGTLMTRVLDDADQVTGMFIDNLPALMVDFVTVIVATAIMFALNPVLALAAIILLPISSILSYFIMPRLWMAYGRRHRAARKLNSGVNDNIVGARVVRAFGRQDDEKGRFASSNRLVRDAEVAIVDTDSKITAIFSAARELANMVVFATGACMIMTHTFGMDYALLITFTGYVGMLSGPIDTISMFMRQWVNCMNSAQRIFEIIDARPDVEESENPTHLENIKGEVELKRVCFAYDKGNPVLTDVSFKVKAGQMLGIVGRSGAGKSTLLNLISRLYDVDEGQVLIDGVDIRDVAMKDLRGLVAMVSQETYIFMGTVAENIAYARPDATPQQIIKAAKAASAHDFIMKLPDGYDTLIGTSGRQLSGGERQRLSIARAILTNPKILMLDEATAAVDTETEINIQQALSELIKGRTTISVAHRLSTLRDADSLVVIEEGKVVERGTHRQLIEKKGEYYRLANIQHQALKKRGLE